MGNDNGLIKWVSINCILWLVDIGERQYYRVACQLFLPIPETQNDLGAAQFFAPVYQEFRRAGGHQNGSRDDRGDEIFIILFYSIL